MAVEKKTKTPVPPEQMPRHVAFIMDGNGRWAQQRKLPRIEGHRAGSKVMNAIGRYAADIGIETVTFYAFSTENWKRSKEEVDALMLLMEEYLDEMERKANDTARLIVLGDTAKLSDRLQRKIESVKQKSAANTGITINIAFNYGARNEIVRAVRSLATQCVEGSITIDSIDDAAVSGELYTVGQHDPDMIIRPSGEMRLSNFLLWQAAYSELVFMDVLWPNFTAEHLNEAIREYSGRDRRFGGR